MDAIQSRWPILSVAAVTCAVGTGQCANPSPPVSKPVATMISLEGSRSFGARVMADGDTVAAVDYSDGCGRGKYPCLVYLRTARLDGTRVRETARELLPRRIWGVAFQRERFVVRADEGFVMQLRVSRRTADGWLETQAIELGPSHEAWGRHELYLGDDLLVTAWDRSWQLYVMDGGRWRLDARFPLARGAAVSRGRFIDVQPDAITLYERGGQGWTRVRTIEPPAGHTFEWNRFAAGDRWAVVGDGPSLLVYDLDTGALAATLRSQGQGVELSGAELAIGEQQLVAAGEVVQRWRYTGGGLAPARHPGARAGGAGHTVAFRGDR